MSDRVMRRFVAVQLHKLAARLYPCDHTELIEVFDEWGITRCRVEVNVDDIHGVRSTFVELPAGWHLDGGVQ